VCGLQGAGQLHLGRGPNLTAKVVRDMIEDYGIHHRINSVANTHTNARAELGDKTVKRMLMDIVSAKGILDQRCKKWWNRGTRFPESKLACRKFCGHRREIVGTITGENSEVFVKNYADY
jgi:hypothetical protein